MSSTLMTLKTLTATDVKYRIMQCAKELNIPNGIEVEVVYFPNTGSKKFYSGKTHNTTAGRIDKMSYFYNAVQPSVGDRFIVRYPRQGRLEVIDIPNCIDGVVLNPSDVKYNIFTTSRSLGIPLGETIGFYAYIDKRAKFWTVKTHKTTSGRIDGLGDFYKEYEGFLHAGKKMVVAYVPGVHIVGHNEWKGTLYVFEQKQIIR